MQFLQKIYTIIQYFCELYKRLYVKYIEMLPEKENFRFFMMNLCINHTDFTKRSLWIGILMA